MCYGFGSHWQTYIQLFRVADLNDHNAIKYTCVPMVIVTVDYCNIILYFIFVNETGNMWVKYGWFGELLAICLNKQQYTGRVD